MQHSTFYSSHDSFYVAVDCVIFGFSDDQIRLLVHKRAFEPAIGGLSLMGGFVNKEESVNQAATRVLSSLTGLENIYMEQVGVYGKINRDPGARVISSVFYALIDISAHNELLLKEHNAFWVNVSRTSELIFDHLQMVNDALHILRNKADVQPIGFNLMPEKFTLPQLQSLYEAIYDQPLDKRNFRKKVQSLDFLEKLDEIDKSNSKKGAYFYKFKEDKALLSNVSKSFKTLNL